MGDWLLASWWGLGVAAAFLFDWAAIALEWKAIKPFSKPLAMGMVILWTVFSIEGGFSPVHGWLLAAQFFGLLGDIFLLLPEKAFPAGLGAFLFGHFIYIGLMISTLLRFIAGSSPAPIPWRDISLGLALWVGTLILIYHFLKSLSVQKRVSQWLWAAIQAYSWVLSALVSLALIASLQSSDPLLSRAALPLGAFLFLISDSMLTYNRFIQAFSRAQLWVRITYHLAQFSLAWGFLALLG